MFARTRPARISKAVRWCLAAILIVAGAGHLQNPHVVLYDVLNYGIVTGTTAVWAAMLLPFCELAMAALLLSKCPDRWVGVSAVLMFGVFAGVQWSAWSRNLAIDCGCFGAFFRRPVGWPSLLLIHVMLVVSFIGAISQSGHDKRDNIPQGDI